MTTGKSKDHSAEFGRRVRARMVELGLVSPTSRSGVDVSALAKAAGCSYEMARRYADGVAVPRMQTIESIAEFLRVSPAHLVYTGRASTASPPTVDRQELEKCLTAVQEAARRLGRSLSNEQTARIVAALYAETAAGRRPSTESLELLIRAT
jgi:transcriptional regulator with XRE-family HTH domain